MKKLIFIFLILSPALCKAQKDSIRYEMYVRCCMGEVSPNDVELLYNVYKDTSYIGFTFGDHIILPDTGCYYFQRKKDTFTRCFEHGGVFRDTFDIHGPIIEKLSWNSQKKRYENPLWKCNGCILDGYLTENYESKEIKLWEGEFKQGILIWYKWYDENGNLIYYSKRNFWGKEKVKLDKRKERIFGKKENE